MAVTSEQSIVVHTGNGVTTAFPVPFPFPAAAALVVTLAGVVQTLDVDYTVTGGEEDGEVTMGSAPDDGDDLVIERTLPFQQLTPFRDQGDFSPAVHEDALDYLTMLAQQLDRSIGDVATDLETLDARVDDIATDVGAAMVPAGGIDTTRLADGAVTTSKLADGGVTRPKLAPVGQQVSAATNSANTSSTTYVVANPGGLTVTLTTTGRPVVVGLMPDGSGFAGAVSIYAAAGALSAGYVAFSSNGGTSYIAEANVTTQGDGGGGPSTVVVPPGAFNALWVPAAGTYTVTVHFRVSVATATLALSRVRLYAYEL